MKDSSKDERLDYEVCTDFEDRLIEQSRVFVPIGSLLDYRLIPQSALFRELKDMSEAHLDAILNELWKYPNDEKSDPAIEQIGLILSSRVANELIARLKGK